MLTLPGFEGSDTGPGCVVLSSLTLMVRVAVDERGALGQRGRVVDAVVHAGAKDVAVCQEQLAAGLVEQRGIVGHDGEVEHHLVDLGVAAAAHRDDAVGQGVEQRDYALGA